MNSPMLPKDTFKDKVIVVTGGGTGLGKAMSIQLSKLGALVVITSRKEEVLAKTAKEITAITGNPVYYKICDIRHSFEVEKMRDDIIAEHGNIDGLINNAAGNFISPTERLSSKAFGIIIDIVLKGTINCTLAFGKHWIDTKTDASVVNIVTTYAFTGSGYVVPSACAKAGVLAMTRSLAVEWAKYNIRLNAIAPGPFPTKGAWDRLFPGEMAEKFALEKRVPMKRVGKKEELCDLASYLLSNYSAYINGEVITIDGGEWLQGAGQFNQLEAIEPEMWDTIEQMIRKKNS
ncbi:MAG: NAD(P)-dependent dehydrogenase (short-subunit alcohol dehydrogenase family) [Flavobacteriales bacterium]|jgi:NAD(P)-dependent dehydrogenase (short-subunit alcohol dehydrogenase family)